ncbi:MAG: UDP-N-acetylmuramate dehydrogenase [Gemmatimonadota bacterium]
MTATANMDWKEALEAHLGPDTIEVGVPLAPLTTFRIGGPADLFFRATTAEKLVAVLTRTRELGVPTFLLGRGANILVGDGGFRGLVIQCLVGGIDFLDPQRVRAGAGVEVFPSLIRATVEAGLGGLHHFVGIPSSVGGAIWQNLHFLSPAPARERTVFIEEFVESAEIFSEEGRREEVDREYFSFGYDYSILHDRSDTVLSVTFRLSPHPLPEMKRVMQENLRWRRERHPDLLRHPSAGSIFKKVEGVGAGRLIDQCGLKGRIHGGAQIFEGHANIIVNLGGATAADVLALMALAQETVYAQTGQTLAPEITMVGEF